MKFNKLNFSYLTRNLGGAKSLLPYYNFYGNVIIFKEEPPVSWDNYSYYKLGGNYNLAFDDISLNNNILSISQASSYNYYVQGIVF